MSDLNYFRIAQLLGGTVTEVCAQSFGCFGAAQASAERFRLIPERHKKFEWSHEKHEQLVDAFAQVHKGLELDAVLIDPALSKKLMAQIRRRGIDAPQDEVFKRMQAIRKNKATYKLEFEKAIRSYDVEPEPYYFAAEMAYVQLNYRRDASVDDIVTEAETGARFVTLCKAIAPHGSAVQFKWAALDLRKQRYFTPVRRERLIRVEAGEIEDRLEPVGTLAELKPEKLPDRNGIFSIAEVNSAAKYLYVGSGELRARIKPFRNARPFRALTGSFWKPDLHNLVLSAGEVRDRRGQPTARDLGFRLIEERQPLFNMPVEIEESDEVPTN